MTGIEPAYSAWEAAPAHAGHAQITTTLDIYTHLSPDDDASGDMAALEAMSQPASRSNVVRMRRRS